MSVMNPDEAVALIHAEKEWNPLRVVNIGSAHFNPQSGSLAKGQNIPIGARDTRVSIVILNMSSTDYLVVNNSENGGTGKPPVNSTGAIIPPGQSLPLPTRALMYICAPDDASASVAYSYVEYFD